MTLLDVLLLGLILAAIALCIYLIFFLKQLNKNLEKVQNDLHQLTSTTIPILENFESASKKALEIASTAEQYFNEANDSVEKIRSKIKNLTSHVKTERTDQTVMDFITNLKAIVKGLSVFIKGLRKP